MVGCRGRHFIVMEIDANFFFRAGVRLCMKYCLLCSTYSEKSILVECSFSNFHTVISEDGALLSKVFFHYYYKYMNILHKQNSIRHLQENKTLIIYLSADRRRIPNLYISQIYSEFSMTNNYFVFLLTPCFRRHLLDAIF